jgi:ribosomal protein L11 methyltransferase
MKKTSASLWRIGTLVPEAHDELAAEILGLCFETAASTFTHAETRQTEVVCYVEAQQSMEKLVNAAQCLQAAFADLTHWEPVMSQAKIKREDWAESWKKHFKPIRIGKSLLLKPSWDKAKALPGQATVILDPGLSFGTGQHPTTRFCLRQVVQARQAGAASLLDIGTGSGILAIAAAKLGYATVDAFDFDPESVRVAGENVRKNRVENKIRLRRADLTGLPLRSRQRYAVVCANLTYDLLLQERQRILNRLAPGGCLVLAGILTTQFGRVQEAFLQAGLTMQRTRVENEWQSGCFAAPIS